MTLPNSLLRIDHDAFEGLPLQSVTFGNSLKSVGDNAFANTSIASLSFPNSLESIGKEAFTMCENLKSIFFGEGLKNIGEKAFAGCSLLSADISEISCDIVENAFDGCKSIINTDYSLKSLANYINSRKIGEIGYEIEYVYNDHIHDSYYGFKGGFIRVSYNLGNVKGYDIINKKGKVIGHSGKVVAEGLAMIEVDDQSGYVLKDTNGKVLTKMAYDSYGKNFESKGLLCVKKGDRYGYIDKAGKEVLPCKYYSCYDFHDGMAIVSIIDTNNNEKYGYIDDSGKEVVPCIYEKVEDFNDGIACVYLEYNGWGGPNKSCIIDKKGNVLDIPFKNYSEGIAIYKSDDKYGYVDKYDKKITPCIYDRADSFKDGLAHVNRGGKGGFIDKSGKEIVPCVYNSVHSFHDDMLRVVKDGKTGYVDRSGKLIIPCIYDSNSDFYGGFVIISKGKGDLRQLFFLDKSGKENGPFDYDNICDFIEDTGMAAVQRGGYEGYDLKIGYIDGTGNEIIPCIYDNLGKYHDIQEGLIPALTNGKMGYIDKSGKTIIPFVYDKANSFSEGLAIVEKDGKFGFIDKTGKSTFDY